MAMLLVISVFKCRYHLVQKKKKFKNKLLKITFEEPFFFFFNENGMFEIFSWRKKLEFFVENVVEGNSANCFKFSRQKS